MGLYNLAGMVKFDSISWKPPVLEETRKIIKTINDAIANPPTNMASEDMDTYKRLKILYTLRGCEVEANYSDWYDHAFYTSDKDVY